MADESDLPVNYIPAQPGTVQNLVRVVFHLDPSGEILSGLQAFDSTSHLTYHRALWVVFSSGQ